MDETERRLKRMERHLTDIYTRANKEIGETWKAYMSKAGESLKPLQDAYEAAKRSGDPEAIRKAGKALGQKQREVTLMDKHYRAMTEQLAQELSNVNRTAAAYINNQLPDIYALNYNDTANGIKDTVDGISFELVDANTVKRLATTDETLLPYKYVDGKKDVRWNTQRVNSEVLQGIIQGESIPKISKRLSNVTEMNRTSAVRNARTAVTGAENRGRIDMLHNAKDKGVDSEKVWLAAHDARVRDSHKHVDGEHVGIDDEFSNGLQYPGDPQGNPAEVYNCRCTLTYKVLGFGENHATVQRQEPEYEFVPAKTIEEAENYISQYVDKSIFGATGVDYTGIDLNVANEVNRVMSDLQRTFNVGKFGGITAPAGNTKAGKMIDGATMAYSPTRKSYYLNRKSLKNTKTAEKAFAEEQGAIKDILAHPEKYDMSKASRQVARVIENSKTSGRATIPTNIEQALQHEFGHSLERMTKNDALWSEASENMRTFAPRVSGYACQDSSEYIAESFCSYMQGEGKIDPVLARIFDGFRR